jgi:flagellar biosynthetic protein FlhB
MAEDQDDGQKTEEPTQRRLDEARRKGQVASSREVNHALVLGGGALLIGLLAPALGEGIARALRPLLERPHAFTATAGDLDRLLATLLGDLGLALAPAALLLVVAAAAGGLIQNGLVVSGEALAPKLDKVSPLAGARRLFSLRSLVEFGKSLLKLALVGAAAGALLWPAAPTIIAATDREVGALLPLLQLLALRLLGGLALLVALIALLDTFYQRFEHRKQLRMSRRDLQDEFKQTEGDPHVKARLRSLRMERARRRMMAEVPKSTVVITNPTHVAVALRYEPPAMAAPRLVAKGAGPIALRIRELAREHGVPVVENPPLARALHAAVGLEAEIPPAHYRAVAEVIGYVMRLRGGRGA